MPFGAEQESLPVAYAEAVPVNPNDEYSMRSGISSMNADMKAIKASSKGSKSDRDRERDRGEKSREGRPKLDRMPSLADTHPPKFGDSSRSTSVTWPSSLLREVIGTFTRPIREKEAKKFVAKHNWSRGLQESLLTSCRKIPIRFFIVDDSGSMATNDGNRIIRTHTEDIDEGKGVSGKMKNHKAKMVQCTRWAELTESLNFLAELSEVAQAPSEFRLLNGADPVLVGVGNDDSEGLAFTKEVLDEDPAGQTPLCHHIKCVVAAIEKMAPEMRRLKKKAAVIICSDGESSDGKVSRALEPLRNLPALVVIRLCTDHEKIVDYWNNIDKELELEMDVIDDLVQDAKQVKEANPWLVYGDELHRLREFGAAFKEMDLIDETPLGSEQAMTFLKVLLNRKDLPHPQVDWNEFYEAVKRESDTQNLIFDPLCGAFKHPVDMNELKKAYGRGMTTDDASVACSIS